MRQAISPRAEYRQQENQRIRESASLAEKFPQLKSLTVDLSYYSAEGVSKNSEIKYTVNLEHAKSVFRFDCHNNECVCGDFDLSDDVASAIATRRPRVTGEARCQGWLSKSTIDRIHCHTVLRYTLTLGY